MKDIFRNERTREMTMETENILKEVYVKSDLEDFVAQNFINECIETYENEETTMDADIILQDRGEGHRQLLTVIVQIYERGGWE